MAGSQAEALADFEALAASTFFAAAIDQGDIVGTERADDAGRPPGEWAAVLRHPRIDVLSLSLRVVVRDAARRRRLQLRLTRQALAESLITKDASAYNVQFVGSKPVFIDLGSFERLRKGEPWAGYRQFCELYLNPLYVQALATCRSSRCCAATSTGSPWRRRGDHRPAPDTSTRASSPRPAHARAERKYADADRERDVRAELRERIRIGVDRRPTPQPREGRRSLSWKRDDSTWSGYGGAEPLQRQRPRGQVVVRSRRGGERRYRRLVLDLGANDGQFSRIAVAAGAESVVAVDSDHLVVDRLYRDLSQQGERRILPLVVDLADPSPAIGWRSRERPSFVERMRPDLVLCLAVVHHLALTNNVPLDDIVAFLADFSAPLVVEFPHRDDVMAARLLARKRGGLFDAYDLATWEKAIEQQFTVDDRKDLSPSGTARSIAAAPLRCDLRVKRRRGAT